MEELFLVWACAQGIPRAIAEFEKTFVARVPTYVRHIESSVMFGDEVKQTLRDRLLVPQGTSHPKIAAYTGQVSLHGWLRVVAVRTALNLQRGRTRLTDLREADSVASATADPELAYLKRRYGAAFNEALEASLGQLHPMESSILKLHYLDRLDLDQLAVMQCVHRSTVARRIARAREKVLNETRRLLSTRFMLDTSEFESLLGLVRSQLDICIPRAFRSARSK
jgi:RNA polymerase sigma-70 factor (ECF subfamily)